MDIIDDLREVRDALDVEAGQRYKEEDFAGGDKLMKLSLKLGRSIAALLRSPIAEQAKET